MIAEILVDLNIEELNHTFSYKVAEKIEDKIQVGMRVSVTFGKRTLMGIVLKLKEDEKWLEENEDNKNMKLAIISNLLDIKPSFTNEMLKLGEEISIQTTSNLIAVYMMMLPKALRKKYSQVVKIEENAPSEFKQLFSEKNMIEYKDISKSFLEKGLKTGYLKLCLEVSANTKVKYEDYIKINNEYQKNYSKKLSEKQSQLVNALLKNDSWELKSKVLERTNVSVSVLNTLIKNNIIYLKKVETYRQALITTNQSEEKSNLNPEQDNAFSAINQKLNEYQTFLLHGITGSGKTHIYISLIENLLSIGKQALVLIPEIALTKQLLTRFAKHFGSSQIAVMHSKLSEGEKFDEWRRVRRGEAKLIIGTRSSVFSPFENLGIIIVDEEHDTSYKQENAPKYCAIEVAKLRAKHFKCPVVLGSATPKLESYARAEKGVYQLLELKNRYSKHGLPTVKIENMCENYIEGGSLLISKTLIKEIQERLLKKEQIILFLNKRGYSQYVSCKSCGHTFHCPHCEVSYSYHKQDKTLKCHHCGRIEKPNNLCPVCNQLSLSTFGIGIQKVEEEIIKQFPNAKVRRMDKDTISKKAMQQEIIEAFENEEFDILLGTQMIAKGFDFPNVTLVGILTIDNILNIPDYRGAENAFSLLCQVAGRAGRGEKKGTVIVQTYNPEHYSIQLAKEHNYSAFYKKEMEFRKTMNYPPYSYLCNIEFRGNDFKELEKTANNAVKFLKANLTNNILILGPVIPYIKRANNLYVLMLTVKYKNENKILETLLELKQLLSQKNIKILIDTNYMN